MELTWEIADAAPVGAMPDFALVCPPAGTSGPVGEIRARGNCPLELAGRFLAELPSPQIMRAWRDASHLSRRETAATMKQLGRRLSDAEAAGELDNLVGEAAAFFILSLRHSGLTPRLATRGCRITWHANAGHAEVECLG